MLTRNRRMTCVGCMAFVVGSLSTLPAASGVNRVPGHGGKGHPRAVASISAAAHAAAVELVVNGGLEQGTAAPNCFQTTGWGSNTMTQGFDTTDKHGGTRSWNITLSNRTSGDRKLMLSDATGCAPDVTPGLTYDVSVWYKSTASVNGLTLFRQDSSGACPTGPISSPCLPAPPGYRRRG